MGKIYKNSFLEAGYRSPTPFINIAGRPVLFWLIDHLQMSEADQLYIVVPKDFSLGFAVEKRLCDEYPDKMITVIELQFATRGPLETLLIGSHGIEEERQLIKTLSLDCDTIYFGDIVGAFRDVESSRGVSFYSNLHAGNSRQFSYIRISPDGTIADIREKAVISNHANTGAYGFPSAALLQKCCEDEINCNLVRNVSKDGQEFYLSSLIRSMMHEGHTFEAVMAPTYAHVGNPQQLQLFLAGLKNGQFTSSKKLRIAFDLSGTLLSYSAPATPRNTPSSPSRLDAKKPPTPRLQALATPGLLEAVPNLKNIEMAKQLKKLGHTIIIWSSFDGEQDYKGNFGKLMAEVGPRTFSDLAE